MSSNDLFLMHQKQSRRRLGLATLALFAVFVLYASQLVKIQAVQADELAQTGFAKRQREVTVPAMRGAITDVNGIALATTVPAFNLTIDQTRIVDHKATAKQLAPILGIDHKLILERLSGDQKFVYLARSVTPQIWDRVAKLKLGGIYSERTTRRVYPYADLAGNVIGFVGTDGHGLAGLEAGLESVLAGKDGLMRYEGGAAGRRIPATDFRTEAAIAGTGVRLSIDRDLQYVAQNALAKKVKEANADWGSVVVLEPATGRLLALASVPTVDLNNPLQSSITDRKNRAVTDMFEPGSTGKLMTFAAALEEKAITPTSKIKVPPRLPRPSKVFNDHTPHGHLRLTANGVLAKSSNIGTILIAEKLANPTILHDYFVKFGIGQNTGLGFPGETNGILRTPSKWSNTTFPTMAFGQGYSTNAVQIASVFATIANNGVRMPISLVDGYVGVDGIYQPAAAKTGIEVVSAQTAKDLREMLESVVGPDGTAPSARISGYRVAGKTGTAQRSDQSCGGCYKGFTASFIGMAPANNPSIVVAVIIDNPRNGHYGGVLAGPVFKEVTNFALQKLKVMPQGGKVEKIPATWGR
jgi:cell division protein FtsI (penicillin-binding protein 3)